MTVITASDLNTQATEYTTDLQDQAEDTGALASYVLDVKDLTNGTGPGAYTLDFTAPDDLILSSFSLITINSAAGARTITATLTAIDVSEVNVSEDVLNEQTVSLTLAVNGAATQTTSTSYVSTSGTRLALIKGVTYRMQVTNNTVTNLARAQLILAVETRKRRG